MKDVYVLRHLGTGQIILIADDPERCNMEMARFPASDQAKMDIENHDLHETGN